uniref:RING-type E3 ubiquitin transferase n=1 Tax=Caenorhabditis japonica TaxID=281687 RepID=A0A8R1EUY8_CAEJA
MPRSEQHCRYFTNGICSKGDSCTFVHDQSRRNENVCHFNLVGKCSFGQSCRFLHTRPRNDERPNAKNVKKGENQRVRPVQLKDPVSGLNAHAVEFVPSWKKNTAAVSSPVSYASAISGGPSTSSSAPPPFQLAQLPLCPYFEKNGECSRKDTDCQFVHGDYCDMCNGWSLHPHNEEKRKAHQT